MAEDRTKTNRDEPVRHTHRALAALREAAENLEELAAFEDVPSMSVAKATAHVAAARAVLKPQLFGPRPEADRRDRDAA